MTENPPLFVSGPYKALVIGSNGALGSAFVDAFRSDPNCTYVEAVSRESESGFDLLDAESIRVQASLSSSAGPFDIVVDATGALFQPVWEVFLTTRRVAGMDTVRQKQH